MSTSSNTTLQDIDVSTTSLNLTKPYRWIPNEIDATPTNENSASKKRMRCEECDDSLLSNDFETYCPNCGLIHDRRIFWHTSLDIEAKRREFNHDSENGNGTLQNKHATAVEDSAAATTFDGRQLNYGVYPLDQYNDGRDGHRGQEDDVQKLDRERRFLTNRAEACSMTVGLTEAQIQEVIQLVTSINSGAFTSYGPAQKGGGQDAHIAAAIAFVGNKHIKSLNDRMELRNEFQSVMADMGLERDDVRGAVTQLRKQLND